MNAKINELLCEVEEEEMVVNFGRIGQLFLGSSDSIQYGKIGGLDEKIVSSLRERFVDEIKSEIGLSSCIDIYRGEEEPSALCAAGILTAAQETWRTIVRQSGFSWMPKSDVAISVGATKLNIDKLENMGAEVIFARYMPEVASLLVDWLGDEEMVVPKDDGFSKDRRDVAKYVFDLAKKRLDNLYMDYCAEHPKIFESILADYQKVKLSDADSYTKMMSAVGAFSLASSYFAIMASAVGKEEDKGLARMMKNSMETDLRRFKKEFLTPILYGERKQRELRDMSIYGHQDGVSVLMYSMMNDEVQKKLNSVIQEILKADKLFRVNWLRTMQLSLYRRNLIQDTENDIYWLVMKNLEKFNGVCTIEYMKLVADVRRIA